MSRHYPGSHVQKPFAEMCCWPNCEREIGEVAGPLCERHLTKAFRIYRTSHLFLLEHKPDYLIREPYEKATGRRYPDPLRQTQGLVYFLRLQDLIKIGWTSNLRQRMQDLPHEELLGTVPGTMEDEKRCHLAFKHLRVKGEWFRAEPDLLAFIADITAQEA